MLKVMDLRKAFVEFFKEKEHKIVPSSSLFPKNDPTLLFTTAGMVQFKPMFAGTVELEYKRAVSVQKCLRTSDLENVGRTKRHLTFFEMLGNFSFGDYFKKEAIEFAWEFSTKVIGFPKEKIWVSIYENDDEAFEIWNKTIGVEADKIVRLGKKDNFWGPAGDSGACGPCSELYLDRGESFGCGDPDCKPGCECERFLEFWNLVFNQFNQDMEGNLQPLPQTGIDTGMGLERLATLIQGVDSVYETDEFKTLIDFVVSESGKKYEGANIIPIKVMIDHARALTFAMSDGIYPSNEGRGYVLRRILRRALRFSRQLGINEPFLYKIVDSVVEIMSDFYPEIGQSAKNIKAVIESEEKRFLDTLETGMSKLEDLMKSLSNEKIKTIKGKDAFVLYDTFGFPFEMTAEIALENGFTVSKDEFEAEMENQRQSGRNSWKSGDDGLDKYFDDAVKIASDTVFTGYDEEKSESKIIAVFTEQGQNDKINQEQRGFIVLDKTPFYGESGGQLGDIGQIICGENIFNVEDTKKSHKTIIHIGSVEKGAFSKGDNVIAKIDAINRNLVRANHTATHLLQAALRNILGDHVKQAGSVVSSERLRFDFSHYKAMSLDEISKVEKVVNEKIWQNLPVSTKIMNIDDAVKSGAMAVFDEKYEDSVRVVSVGDFSKELCGGTHVSNSANIGLLAIQKESSPGAGIRRIEAITLKGALEKYKELKLWQEQIISISEVSALDCFSRIKELSEENKKFKKELEKIKKESLVSDIDNIISKAKKVNDVSIISYSLKNADVEQLKSLADVLRDKLSNSVVLLGSVTEDKALLLYASTKSVIEKGIDCGKIMKETAKIIGGGGGGRPDMAQAGGKQAGQIDNALNAASKLAEEALS
jgi:alanyl-tRNA synthetase